MTEALATPYRQESSRPLVSLLFVSPLLLVYELGVIVLGPQTLRNGADVWLRTLLEVVGFGQYFLLPVATCAALLAWHHVCRQRWEVRVGVLPRMALESLVFAAVLLLFANLQHRCFHVVTVAMDAEDGHSRIVQRLVGYCGAGIYEELLFRVCLLPLSIAVLRWWGLPLRWSVAASVGFTSLAFSLAHYRVFTDVGYDFDWYSFTFRFAAGVFFASLFLWRGFGIAVGSHATYDILVELA